MDRVKRLNKDHHEGDARKRFKFYSFAERIAEAGESLLSATRGVAVLDDASDLKEVFEIFDHFNYYLYHCFLYKFFLTNI